VRNVFPQKKKEKKKTGKGIAELRKSWSSPYLHKG